MYMYLSMDHSRVHMYFVVGLCKLGTTFSVNFQGGEETVDFVWACLNDSLFTDHLLFKTGFSAPMGDRKKQFLLYLGSSILGVTGTSICTVQYTSC